MRLEASGRDFSRLFRVFSLRMARYSTSWVSLKIGEKGMVLANNCRIVSEG